MVGDRIARVPAPVLFIGSGLAQYVGAAIAVGLFAVAGAPETAWLRILAAALVLLAWRRPWRLAWTGRALRAAVTFGLVLAAMNIAFYLAIEHLPLGLAVAIEFSGPVAVAAVTGGVRERWGGLLAAVGVVVLSGAVLSGGDAPSAPSAAALGAQGQAAGGGFLGAGAIQGLAWIAVAAVLWAGYVVLGRRVAHDVASHGIASLAVGMGAGALAFAPFFARSALPELADWRFALAILGVGVLSSVVPYAVEQLVLRRVSAATFAVLLALLPATAVVVGAVWLRQVPTWTEVLGVTLVCAAITLTSARRPRSSG